MQHSDGLECFARHLPDGKQDTIATLAYNTATFLLLSIRVADHSSLELE